MLFCLPSQEDLASWHKIKILKDPLGLLNIDFDPNTPKDTYLMQGSAKVEPGVAQYHKATIWYETPYHENSTRSYG